MENSFQTSFIPKKPIIENPTSRKTSSSTSITMVISVILLFIAGLAAGGLYFYKDYLTKNKDQLSASLVKVKESFNNDTIVELEAYDHKSSIARQVLEGHIVLSPLFQSISDLTLSSIQYNKFDHSIVNGVFTVRMSGIARDYKSIALQADVFSSNKLEMFNNLVFSNLTKDKNNYVTFDVEFTVDPSLLSYSNNIKTIKESLDKKVVSNDTPVVNTTDSNTTNDQLLQNSNNLQ